MVIGLVVVFFFVHSDFLPIKPDPFQVVPNKPSVLYNAMIHPFLKMTIFGAIWYQGEANAGAPSTYNCTFPAMIDDWRNKWFTYSGRYTDPLFAFGFVQVHCMNNLVGHCLEYYSVYTESLFCFSV